MVEPLLGVNREALGDIRGLAYAPDNPGTLEDSGESLSSQWFSLL